MLFHSLSYENLYFKGHWHFSYSVSYRYLGILTCVYIPNSPCMDSGEMVISLGFAVYINTVTSFMTSFNFLQNTYCVYLTMKSL